MLGVARATVCEMIAPLEQAGLVKRWPCWWAPHEIAAAFADFEDEPDVPWVGETL